MKLTIIAATGGVGRELLQQGLAARPSGGTSGAAGRSCADVAHFMLHVLGEPGTMHQAIGIAS